MDHPRKVVLVQICKAEQIQIPHHNCPPLGLLYIGSALKQAGFGVQIYHLLEEETTVYQEQILSHDPLYVGFSVFTGSPMRAAAEMGRGLKKHNPKIPIVWGNVHPTYLTSQCLTETYIDIVCRGEGEITAVDLARALQGQCALEDVQGIGYRNEEDGRVVVSPRRPQSKNLDSFVIDWEMVDLERYIVPVDKYKRSISMVTSRGCPHDCRFCYNSSFHHRKWRGHSADAVVAVVEHLIDAYKIDAVRFRDDNFFANRKRAFEIVSRIDIPFYAGLRIDYVDDAFMAALKKTQCYQLFFGMESGSSRILKNLVGKNFTASDIEKVVNKFHAEAHHVLIVGSFIFGLPTEEISEFQKTIELIIKLLDINPRMSFATGCYLPYPGSRLYDLALANGFNVPQRTQDWEILDRWQNNIDLSWVDWLSGNESLEWSRHIRLLAFCYRNRIMFFKQLLRWRLRKGFFEFPLDAWLLDGILQFITKHHKNKIVRVLKKIFNR